MIALLGLLTPATGGEIRGVGRIVAGLTERFGEPVQRALSGGRSQLEFTNPKNGVRFIVREEVHPLKPGGPPVPHTNVEVHKPTGEPGRYRQVGNAHLDTQGRPIP